MKIFYLTVVLTLAFLTPVSVSFAAPNYASIDGVFGYNSGTGEGLNEWTGDSWGADAIGDQLGDKTFDVFGVGLDIDDTKLYWALDTAFEANYREGDIYPGHIAIDFVGSSVQGGDSDGYDFAISLYHPSGPDTYEAELASGIYETEYKIYRTDGNSYWDFNGTDNPFRLRDGTDIGIDGTTPLRTSKAFYNRSGGSLSNPDRNFFEGAVELQLLTAQLDNIDTENGYKVKIYWVEGCENDSGYHEFNVPGTGTPGDVVPEPGTFLLFGMGLIGLGALGRKKEKEKKSII